MPYLVSDTSALLELVDACATWHQALQHTNAAIALQKARVQLDGSGFISVQPDTMRTSVPHVFAAGDCAMPNNSAKDQALTSRRYQKQHTFVALAEGEIAAAAACGKAATAVEYMHVPTAVCAPELGICGPLAQMQVPCVRNWDPLN